MLLLNSKHKGNYKMENTNKISKMESNLRPLRRYKDNTIGDIEERKLGSKVLIMLNEGRDRKEIVKQYKNYMDVFSFKKSNRNYQLNEKLKTELKKYLKNDK